MAWYIGEDGGVCLDEESLARMLQTVEDLESGKIKGVRISGLTREQMREYLSGNPSPETLAKIAELNPVGD